MRSVDVVRTYMQMTECSQHMSGRNSDLSVRIERAVECPVSFYRYLYTEVGRNYFWLDRLLWSDQQIRDHLSLDNVSVWVMYDQGSPAGYFELHRHHDESIEIAYFGLLPEFIGKGLGKHLLSVAIDTAWNSNPVRVWLHTCTLDDPAAIPNYKKRGFQPYKTETYTATLPD